MRLFGMIAAFGLVALSQGQGTATGFVFEDKNKNGVRDAGEPGIANVLVSNQEMVVKTDRNGRWTLPSSDDVIFFVIKPTDMMTPVDSNNKPTRYYYVHKPAGSPANLRYKGVDPTGPLPSSIDFPLLKKKEPRRFTMAFFGDTQPYSMEQVQFTAQDAIAEVAGRKDILFGVSLGDVVGDNLNLLPPLKQAKSTMGVPWHYVIGNHDVNMDVTDDALSDEAWARLIGPAYYAFEVGGVSFINLDDVHWKGQGYHAELGAKQLKWLENYLKHVPKNRMLVFMQHIPITELRDRNQFFALFNDRPNNFSIAAHWHMQQHFFMGADQGWKGSKPHHHLVAATVCGSWWGGELDELGIPHTTMRDGAPRGYLLGHFTPTSYDLEFKATRRMPEYQLNVFAPHSAKVGERVEVVANVFFGTQKCQVEMRVGGGEWRAMAHTPNRPDPFYQAMKKFEEDKKTPATGGKLPGTNNAEHLWVGFTPANLKPGGHLLEVRVKNFFGREFISRRVLWVE